MIRKLMLVLAVLLVASLALAQQSPTGQGPTRLNGGVLSAPATGWDTTGNNMGTGGLGRHDLQDAKTSQPLGCESCHLPHTAPTYGQALLWAWSTVPTKISTYVTATNPSGALVTPTSGVNGPPGNTRSMLCFTCHDGTSASANGVIASVTFSGAPYQLITTTGGVGSLGSEHPVDAMFPTTNDYVQPTKLGALGMYGTTATVGTAALPLWDSVYHVECTTCHDVHNDYLTDNGTFGGVPFLRVANTSGTFLCRQCHNAQ